LFSAVEIVSEKDEGTYRRILDRHDIAAGEFLMVGNSLRSDVLPVLAIGGRRVCALPHDVAARAAVDAPSDGYWSLRAISELPARLEEAGTSAPASPAPASCVGVPVCGKPSELRISQK
jgi:putative hydrolase of the HAD superfamily